MRLLRLDVRLVLIVLPLLLAAHSTLAIEPAAVHVPQSQQWSMHSVISGRTYEIFIALPDGPVPAGGYTALYVLDGNSMFLTTVDAVRAYSRRRDSDAKALVIGIGYPQGTDIAAARVFDLTPDVTEPRSSHPGGGADAFMDFIVHELKPDIAAKFAIHPQRQALIGHSLGGRLTLDMLARHPDAFQYYVAMSASFWFGQHDLVRRIEAFVHARRQGESAPVPVRVLLSAGEFEQQPRPDEWWRDPARALRISEDLGQRGQITHAQNTANALAALPGIHAQFQEIAGEDHGSVIPSAIGRAVRFVLLAKPMADVP